MAFKPGKGQVFKLDDESDTLVDISSYLTNISPNFPLDAEESQTIGDNSKERVITLADGQITLEGFYDKSADSFFDVVKEVYTALRDGTITSVSWEYYPEGETTGDPKISGEAVLQSFTITGGVGTLVTFSCVLDCTGDITVGTA